MRSARASLIFAFASVYLIWGSTYLAMHIMVETLPPFLAAGLRHGIAGLLLLAFCALRGKPIPTSLRAWAGPAWLGILFLALGNGVATWAMRSVQSGVGALIIAVVPLMAAGFEAFGPQKKRLPPLLWLSLATGLAGMAWLVAPHLQGAEGKGNTWGVAALFWAALCWAWGGVTARDVSQPADAGVSGGMQMLAGGLALILAGLIAGEGSALSWQAASARSLWALAYLIGFGSLVAYTSFQWLLRVAEPAKVTTYAYVNPVVAVFLGWWILKEPVTLQTLLASLVVTGSVAVAVSVKRV